MKMRAVRLAGLGDASQLTEVDLTVPVARPHEVLIRVKAVAFNPIDYQLRQVGATTMRLPVTLGFDVAGIIEARGADVSALSIGDEVCAYLGGPSLAGGYAQYAAAPHWFVAKKPASLSFVEAASVPLTAITALQSLRRAKVGSGKSLLIAGGSGGVGSWAIQIAKALGVMKIVTTAGSDASRNYLADTLGLTISKIVDYRGLDRAGLAAATLDANNSELFDATLDCVGGAMTNLCCDVIDYEGHVVSIVNGPRDASQDIAVTDEERLFEKSATFHFELVFALAEQPNLARQVRYAKQLTELAAMIDAGAIMLPKVTNLGAFSSRTARIAHAQLESGHTKGKLVATFD
jgi:NADPH:quinone reductase-like Zn-dependent oxidoreductase